MTFSEYRSPWETRGDIETVYRWIAYFAVVWTSLDARAKELYELARSNLRYPQLTFEDGLLMQRTKLAFASFEVSSSLDCMQVIAACTCIDCIDLKCQELPLPEI